MADAHPDFAPDKESVVWLVPVGFFSQMMSEAFWQDERILRKSDGFFHRIDNFCSRVPQDIELRERPRRPPPEIERRAELEAVWAQGQLSPAFIDLIMDWDQRKTCK